MRTLVEVGTFTTDVQVPEDGDPRNAASVDAAFQALANRAKYLKAALEAGDLSLSDRLAILETYQQASLSGSSLDRGDYLTIGSLAGSSGFSLADSNKKLVVPAPTGIYHVNIHALLTLDSSMSDDTTFLKIHSTTSGDISATKTYGAACDIAPGVTFVHTMDAFCNGDIYVLWDTAAATARQANVTYATMSIRRVA